MQRKLYLLASLVSDGIPGSGEWTDSGQAGVRHEIGTMNDPVAAMAGWVGRGGTSPTRVSQSRPRAPAKLTQCYSRLYHPRARYEIN